MRRGDREDVSAQRAAVHDAAHRLSKALDTAHHEARHATRTAARGRRPDLTLWHAAVAAVARAEEALDVAEYDLSTASGADG